MKELLKACKENKLYDYIANNYYKMTNEELKNVCLEAIYLLDNDNEIGNQLKERFDYE